MTERRYDPTSDEWVTFATQRQGRTYKPSRGSCPLCPSPAYPASTEIPRPRFGIAVFDNRFPSLTTNAQPPTGQPAFPLAAQAGYGHCEVIVYSASHTATLSDLPHRQLRLLVDVWADRTQALGADPRVNFVLPFENKGEEVGATLHHPHGQIYAYPDIPPRQRRLLATADRYASRHGRCVRCDVLNVERSHGERTVLQTPSWHAWVPFWARFPYEVNVAPTRHLGLIGDLGSAERDDLARVLSSVTRGYDKLFGFSLPYVMAWQQQPADPRPWPCWHLYLEFLPPHRSADRLKFLAGSELTAGAFLTDVAPETAAGQLRQAIR